MKKKLIVLVVVFVVFIGALIFGVVKITGGNNKVTIDPKVEESTFEETVVIEEEETTPAEVETLLTETVEAVTEEKTTTAESEPEEETIIWQIRRFYEDGTLYDSAEYENEAPQSEIDRYISEWDEAGYDLIDTVYTDLPSVDLYFSQRYVEESYITSNVYGIPDWQIERAMKLVTIEGYWMDDYMDYLMACTVINRLVEDPYCDDIYSSWGGSDGWYGSWMDSYDIADHARIAVNAALANLDTRAWDCHGLVAENGYHSVQLLSEAIYYSSYNGTYFGVWDRSAGWYQV